LIHDYFTQRGGAERVVEHLYQLLPKPDVFATVLLDECVPACLSNTPIATSWMQNLPNMKKWHRLYFALYPIGVRALDLSAYDVVISSSSSYAKGVCTRAGALHICYCHTPMRWVWQYGEYVKRENLSYSQRLALPLLLSGLRAWDKNAARQPDQFIANSSVVAARIQEAYRRTAVVINPAIEVDRFRISAQQDDFYLVLSRLVPYKRIDLAIEACNLLRRRLVVIGTGPDRERLERLAGPTVEFKGRLSDEDVEKYAATCRALLFPGEEDFGMAPLEIAAAGRPTIAFGAGGALETIIHGTTGTFFKRPEARSMAEGIEESESRSWCPSTLRQHAMRFDVTVFRRKMRELLKSLNVTCAPEVMEIEPEVQAAASGA
jgi:glycosyltransferase involved in cell wall biosynthesis